MDELQPVTIFDIPHYEESEEQLEADREYLAEIEPIIEEFISFFGDTCANNCSFYARGIDFNDLVDFYDDQLVNNLGWEVIDDFPKVDDFEAVGYIRNEQMLIVTLIALESDEVDCVLLILADDPDYVEYDSDEDREEEEFVEE
jgi:hypothetical protein